VVFALRVRLDVFVISFLVDSQFCNCLFPSVVFADLSIVRSIRDSDAYCFDVNAEPHFGTVFASLTSLLVSINMFI
jgi:hypothetical protein